MNNNALLIYGGCTGVGKSNILKRALSKFNPDEYELINISDIFLDFIKINNPTDENILWSHTFWKKYDKNVLGEVKDRIAKCGKKLVIINKHFATISPHGYLPGIDMDALDLLLLQQRSLNRDYKGNKPIFGLLLIDTEVKAIQAYYEKEYAKSPVLNYISTDYIIRDLEKNREWAESYCSRAIATIGQEKVISDTIYVEDSNTLNAENEVMNFIISFGLQKI